MNKPVKFLAAAALLTTGLALSNTDANAAKEGFEKCYGVVKAGKNDCGAANGSHSCAGAAKKDGDKNEWVYLPQGSCDRIVGGSTTPPAA